MRKIETEVLVIGGGATGAGVVRDAALRGFKRASWKPRLVTAPPDGTTACCTAAAVMWSRTRKRQPSALKKTSVLRRIMPHCIEDTGGFFVVTPWDDADFGDRFMQGCEDTGVPVRRDFHRADVEGRTPSQSRNQPLFPRAGRLGRFILGRHSNVAAGPAARRANFQLP